MTAAPIRLVLSDVDGTLVTNDKQLTARAAAAVGALHDAGIQFAVTSGRPPRGMSMLIEPLALTTPIAAFNGGVFVRNDLSVISQKEVPSSVVAPIVELIGSHGLDPWMYCGADWYVLDPNGAHVDRESRTVQFAPTVVDSFDSITDPVAKIVGVSNDHDAVAAAATAAREQFAHHVSATRSQPYYLDVTHPDANKGSVMTYLSEELDIPPASIATLGDMPNDVLMFAHCGMSIAMGNADREVQRAARYVTASNEQDGFAQAIEQLVLGH